MDEVAVRPATVADAAGIAAVQATVWRQAYAGLLPAEFLAGRTVDPDIWRSRLPARPPWAVWVAVSDRRTVGYVAVGPDTDDPTVGLLAALYVLAEHWGTGVGHRLHTAAMTSLAGFGFAEAVLWVLEGNARTIAFYRREGWTDDSARKVEPFEGIDLPVVRYRLSGLVSSGSER